MKIVSYLVLLIVILPTTTVLGDDKEIFIQRLEGSWGWENCGEYKHEIKVSQNGEFFEFKSENGSYYYYIAGIDQKGLKLVMMHEDRFDDQNNLVSWFVVMDGKDKYYWLRSDREENDLRGPVSRCK